MSSIAGENKKIRVLHFAKLVSRNDFVDSIVSNLDPDYFEVFVVTFRNDSLTFSPVFKEKSIVHENLHVENARMLHQLVPPLNRFIKKHKIDVFHAHLFEESIIGGILKMMNPKVKFVLGRHYSDEIYLLHTGLKRKFWLGVETFANNKADRIVAGSQMVRDILLQQKVKEEKIAKIPYGFDFEDYRYRKNSPEQTESIRNQYNIGKNDLMLVNVGRLFHLKGQVLLLEVFASLIKKHKNLKLLIIGDGPDRMKLEQIVDRLQLKQHVTLTGWLKDAHTIISAADIIVHPTLSEMFSQLMIEAMALGKPLIINNASGVQDVISNKENGLICTHQFDDWYRAIEMLIENAALRASLGINAEQHVKRTYPISRIIGLYEQLYRNLNSIN